jgi:hypothetical protein
MQEKRLSETVVPDILRNEDHAKSDLSGNLPFFGGNLLDRATDGKVAEGLCRNNQGARRARRRAARAGPL